MTLTEVIVASILVGIVMMGVMAFNVTLNKMQSSSNLYNILAMRALPVLNRIRQDVKLATGNSTDPGIVFANGNSGISSYISIRQDLSIPPTPADNTDDKWIIYKEFEIK